MFPLICVAAWITGVVMLIIVPHFKASSVEMERRNLLAEFASSINYEFYADAASCDPGRSGIWQCLDQLRVIKATNLMLGRYNKFDIVGFDCYDTTKRHACPKMSVICAKTDTVFPKLQIRPEFINDRLTAILGFEDIDFESEEFSRRFYVQSDQKKFAYDVIHQRMMTYLLQQEDWTIHIEDRLIKVYTEEIWQSQKFAEGIIFLQGFVDLIPQYVWNPTGQA